MSKNVVIGIHGAEQALNGTEAIRTPRIPSGTERWVPEDTTRTGIIAITRNGTYKAEDENLYGYSRAIVNVPADTITGKGPDGNDYTVSRDPSTGNIIKTKVPSAIRIVTPPDYVGPYGDGAIINFSGLTVEALYADGSSAGMVPFNQLVFPVTVAHFDADAEAMVYTNAAGINAMRLDCVVQGYHRVKSYGQWIETFTGYVATAIIGVDRDGKDSTMLKVAGPGASFATIYDDYIYVANIDGDDSIASACYNDSETDQGWAINAGTSTRAPEGYFTRSAPVSALYMWGQLPHSTADPAGVTIDGLTPTGEGGVRIPVQWPRTGDGMMLETDFGISVVPGPSGSDG